MQPNSPLFRSGVQPRKLWDESRAIAGQARQLQVFRWENRLVCHEDATDLWWATLDPFGGEDAREFWDGCVETNQVARLTALRRGFELRQGDAHLAIDALWFDVLVAADNGGLARIQGESRWHEFAPIAPRRVSKPLTRVPSIWSPRFSTEFARRSTRNLALSIVQQTPGAHDLWQRGANARSIRLMRVANMLGWVESGSIYRHQSTPSAPEFWDMAIANASRRLPAASAHISHSLDRNPFSLPEAMRRSAELTPQLRVNVGGFRRSSHHKICAVWRDKQFSIRTEFWAHFDSAHETLEAKIELRDWLSQFFPPDEVNQWIE